MKLLTHNMLTSPGVAKGFPLKIVATKVETMETDFNAHFVARMVEKLEWGALLGAVEQLGLDAKLPAAVPEGYAEDETFLRALHHVIVEVEVVEGELICPETSRKFPIKGGIPSMI
mmetsp:Transcript_27220/g.80077  ORF Transcript_27220/g.80077 Transcript_27220/m.80077 type:complete len:116 (+) Transcript_27220:32-379(+)